MRIAIDSGPLSGGHSVRGIGVYTKLLLNSLQDATKGTPHTVEPVDLSLLTSEDIKKRFDLIHYPYFDFFFHTLSITSPVPRVVTIHDTIPLIFPEHYPSGIKGALRLQMQKVALRNVQAVITDSQTSKKDIVRLLGLSEKKVTPIYLGPTVEQGKEGPNSSKVLSKYKINFPYVLYIGDVNWNKNLVNLAQVCQSSHIHLVIVGKRAVSTDYDRSHIENKALRDLQENYGDSKYVHRIGFVADEDMPAIIKQATLLCQPSFYEGFGLSVLDAMKLHVPTVCAHTQTLVELYESGSVFFNPADREDMTKVITKVFQSKSLQKQLIKKGNICAKKFSWDKAARQTLEVYQNALK